MTAESQPVRTLAQRIAAIMGELDAVQKSGKTNYGDKFAYHTAADIFSVLQKKMATHGVVVVPCFVSAEPGPFETKGGSPILQATMHFQLINADNPTDCLT